MAETPEASDYTSVKHRIKAIVKARQDQKATTPTDLFPFVGYPRKDMPDGLPFKLTDYLVLMEWTGRIIRDDKRGAILANLPLLLEH